MQLAASMKDAQNGSSGFSVRIFPKERKKLLESRFMEVVFIYCLHRVMFFRGESYHFGGCLR